MRMVHIHSENRIIGSPVSSSTSKPVAPSIPHPVQATECQHADGVQLGLQRLPFDEAGLLGCVGTKTLNEMRVGAAQLLAQRRHLAIPINSDSVSHCKHRNTKTKEKRADGWQKFPIRQRWHADRIETNGLHSDAVRRA